MRVISGTFGGRKLKTLPGANTRPTTGKVKEAVFSSLQTVVPGKIWLDLFAGSGGIGIEALSRGAKFVWFVEKHFQASEIIKENLNALNISQEKARLLYTDAEAACRIIAKECGQVVDIVYIDPPYSDRNSYVKVITDLPKVMVAGGLVVIEHERDYEPTVENLVIVKTKIYGSSAVSIYQYGKGE